MCDKSYIAGTINRSDPGMQSIRNNIKRTSIFGLSITEMIGKRNEANAKK